MNLGRVGNSDLELELEWKKLGEEESLLRWVRWRIYGK